MSNCIEVRPGRLFTLSEHPDDVLNTRWQPVTVVHHGYLPQSLQEDGREGAAVITNHIHFISGTVHWSPPFKHKPLADGPEVATVVGPESEEIFTNELGQVRVHFHWNRYDRQDEKASCWLRVSQGWNGDNYGFYAVPRIGQEVIVDYLDGDLDRPIVTGCVYNGNDFLPMKLPANKTQTIFRTKTHKGQGFNELRFEDANGHEHIYMHAQKDFNIEVRHDQTYDVGHDRDKRIGNDQRTLVGQDERLEIGRDQYILINQNQQLDVKQDRFAEIGRHYRLEIQQQRKDIMHANYVSQVDGDQVQKIEGQLQMEAGESTLIHTRALTLNGSDRVTIQGPAGKITIDGSGITLDSPSIRLNGMVAVSAGAAGQLKALESAAKRGVALVEVCSICKY